MITKEQAAREYALSEHHGTGHYTDIQLEEIKEYAYLQGVEWENNKYAVMASNAVQRAILQHNQEEQKRVLKNYRKICGCFHQGLCTVDCKKCTFHRCETLKDLFKD